MTTLSTRNGLDRLTSRNAMAGRISLDVLHPDWLHHREQILNNPSAVRSQHSAVWLAPSWVRSDRAHLSQGASLLVIRMPPRIHPLPILHQKHFRSPPHADRFLPLHL